MTWKRVLVAIAALGAITASAAISDSKAAPYPPALGGTGTGIVPASGTVLIGNGAGTYTPAFLSQGSNISITNGSGTVTIAVTGTATGTVYLLSGGHGISLSPSSITASGTIAVNTSTVIADVVASGNFLPSSTVYAATVNGQSGAVTLGIPATTTINSTQATVFRLVGDGTTVTSTVSGATTTFSIINPGWITTSTFNASGTANYFPYWLGAGLSTSSQIYQSSTGFIGINTTAPNGRLSVAGDVTAYPTTGVYGQLEVTGATAPAMRLGMGVNTSNNTAYLQSILNAVNYEPLLINPNGGNVAVGTTTASQKLDVNGTILQDGSSGSVNGYTLIARRSGGVAGFPDIYASSGGLVIADLAAADNPGDRGERGAERDILLRLRRDGLRIAMPAHLPEPGGAAAHQVRRRILGDGDADFAAPKYGHFVVADGYDADSIRVIDSADPDPAFAVKTISRKYITPAFILESGTAVDLPLEQLAAIVKSAAQDTEAVSESAMPAPQKETLLEEIEQVVEAVEQAL